MYISSQIEDTEHNLTYPGDWIPYDNFAQPTKPKSSMENPSTCAFVCVVSIVNKTSASLTYLIARMQH